ncbi:MAG: glucose-6-phosphate isomerase [Candidatus Pelagibacter sp. TMED165]|nr:MAG: glucose-6-phosphate isomerase [Candidatus Pelagibacter sp. TMED165]
MKIEYFIPNKFLSLKYNTNLNKNFKKIKNLNPNKNQNPFSFFNKNFKFEFTGSEIRSYKKFKNVVIVGMGGSVLGAKAILGFLRHKIKKNFVFLENLDSQLLEKLYERDLKKTLFLVISKSGNTLETLVNLNFLIQKKINFKNIVIISEKSENILFKFSKKNKIKHIAHKKFIGGRFSVLSEVGMLPAELMGLNIKKIRLNLNKFFKNTHAKILKKNVIKLSKFYKSNKFKTIILMNYHPGLTDFLFWYQQLAAESLGKKGLGLLPVVSQAPKDHHSLMQLYLDGPTDKIFYIFSSNKKTRFTVKNNLLSKEINFIKNKNLSEIVNAQKNAFMKILRKKKLPYRHFKINNNNEKTLGELLSYFMIETALLGLSLNINPFNQPAVEEIKIETKKGLS